MLARCRNLASSSSEYIPEIKSRIRAVKERFRPTRHILPFHSRIPQLLTIHIVCHAVKLLNHFPTKGGILDMVSPKAIISGETLHYKKYLSLQIEQYCRKCTKKMYQGGVSYQEPRVPLILDPVVIYKRGYKFYELETFEENCPLQLGYDFNT